MKKKLLKILVIDDHSVVREGLQAILNRSDLNAQFLEAWDYSSARAHVLQNDDLNLILLDANVAEDSGFDMLRQFVATNAIVPIMMLSSNSDSDTVTRALQFGAAGLLPKRSSNEILVSAIRLVLAGGVYIPPNILNRTSDITVSRATTDTVDLDQLGFTGRQGEVLSLLLLGLSNKQICRQMGLAEGTVKVHVRGVLRALSVSSRAAAIAKVNQMGATATELAVEKKTSPEVKRHG